MMRTVIRLVMMKMIKMREIHSAKILPIDHLPHKPRITIGRRGFTFYSIFTCLLHFKTSLKLSILWFHLWDLKTPKRPTTTKPQVPLHHVAEQGFLLVINALLDANVDLNYANEDGNTALHIAIIYEHKEIIEMLINNSSINLRLQNFDGLTPFSTALRSVYSEEL